MIFQAPEFCPNCKTKLRLTKTETDLFCPNIACPERILRQLTYFCSRNCANIMGLSEKILQKLIEKFGIKNVADLYDLPFEEIKDLEGFGELSVDNLQTSLEKSRQIADFKFLAALGIETIGPETAKLICELVANKLTKLSE